MVAGREVTPKDARSTQRLMDYWAHGAGAAKVGWGTDGSYNRCVVELGKYVPEGEVHGLCAKLYHEATGIWPGRHGRKAAAVADLVTVPGVELMKVGTWKIHQGGDDKDGSWTVTPHLIQAALAADAARVLRRPTIRLGHSDSRFTGDPAVGYVDNLRAADDGQTLLGDLVGVPQWLGDIMASAYPDRSIEGLSDYTAADGSHHDFILTGLALLGATRPGVESLQSLQDVARLYDVAAAGQIGGTALTLMMAATDSKPYGDVAYADPANGKYPIDTEEHCRAAWSYINMPKNQKGYSADELAAIKGRIKSAAKKFGIDIQASIPGVQQKGAVMASLQEEIARRLGVELDADDDTIKKALDEKLPEKQPDDAAPPAPEVVPAPVPEPVAAAASAEQLRTVAAQHGLTVVDATVWAQMQIQAAAGDAARAQQLHEADERTLLDALKAGKITAASAPKFREKLSKGGEPRETTLTLLDALPENRAMAVIEAGHGIASEDTAIDAEINQISAQITGVPVGKDA